MAALVSTTVSRIASGSTTFFFGIRDEYLLSLHKISSLPADRDQIRLEARVYLGKLDGPVPLKAKRWISRRQDKQCLRGRIYSRRVFSGERGKKSLYVS